LIEDGGDQRSGLDRRSDSDCASYDVSDSEINSERFFACGVVCVFQRE